MFVLSEELIYLNVEADDAEKIIKLLGKDMLAKNYVKATFINSVIEREKVYPTGLPSKSLSVAIPHTNCKHVNKSCISVGILSQPVNFFMMGDKEHILAVKIVLLLAIRDPKIQIKLLKKLMQVIQDELLLIKLNLATTKEEIMELLRFLEE